MNLWDELERELEARKKKQLLRRLRATPVGFYGSELTSELGSASDVEKHVLDIASNDYLGLSHHPEVVEAAREAAQKFGAGARASRLVSGQYALIHALETELARFKETESALVFSSGYTANLGVVTALYDKHTALFFHKRSHASLLDAYQYAAVSNSVGGIRFWDNPIKLAARLEKSRANRNIIITDAVFSMDGDLLPLPEVLELARAHDALLILDDAHGTGTLGTSGRGTLEHFDLHDERIVLVGTLSKALGSQGGFVCGPQILKEWLVNNARSFIYSTGLNPPAVGAALASLKLIEREPQRLLKLRQNTRFLAEELQELGFDARLGPTPILPVIVGESEATLKLSQQLESRGLWCPAIRPPTVAVGSARLRIGVCAEWDDAVLERIVAGFKR